MRRTVLVPLAVLALACLAFRPAVGAPPQAERDRGAALYRAGNYAEALDVYRRLVLESPPGAARAGEDLSMAVTCLQSLGREDEVDALVDGAAARHAQSRELLLSAARTLAFGVQHQGWLVGGEFLRGQRHGSSQGARWANAAERDRARALRLLVQGLGVEGAPGDPAPAFDYLQDLSSVLLMNRSDGAAWRLGALTALAELPDYEEGYFAARAGTGAPVDAGGEPVQHRAPRSFASAASDGERWRWALEEAGRLHPERSNTVLLARARFLQSQFGVQTLASHGSLLARLGDDDAGKTPGSFALHTLGDDETAAQLATGPRRLRLAAEYNPVRLFQRILEDPSRGHASEALEALAGICEDRRQLGRAAELWRRVIREHGSTTPREKHLRQITARWGEFEAAPSQAAGAGARVDYRFRNGTRVRFTARAIRVRELLDDVREYLAASPRQPEWERVNIANLGWRLVEKRQERYLGDEVAAWELALTPRPDHWDRRVTVATPLRKGGAYLVTASMEGGNESRIILWVDNTAIVKKPLDRRTLLFTADARTGAPVAGAELRAFGWRQQWHDRTRLLGGPYHEVVTREWEGRSDADGLATFGAESLDPNFTWLFTASTPDGRFAHLGFTNVWLAGYGVPDYRQTKVYAITDRPVYRPAQQVRFKVWVGDARYDQEGGPAAGRSWRLEIRNPRGEVVASPTFTADRWGGFEGEYPVPAGAPLGVWGISIPGLGGNTFRVEEYKKPEFEVTVQAPAEPVALGGRIEAGIEARYYFGAPVAKATVRYRVLRFDHDAQWHPPAPWDWLYGPGYWWFWPDAPWYPGWREWGTEAPRWWWWPRESRPPETVAEAEVPIGADGRVAVRVDTALAKEIYGDRDHRYEIVAEVTDESRRTIVGKGSCIATREPYRVFAWADRGWYRAGDEATLHFAARTADGKPVAGRGEVRLLRIVYGDRGSREETVRSWKVLVDERGEASVRTRIAEAAQYRAELRMKDGAGRARSGAALVTVRGAAPDAAFRSNPLELVPDRRDYAPGERVELLVNADRPGGSVLLFVRPSEGVYPVPRLLRLSGRSALEEIAVVKGDMPNFFVEAVSVSDGAVHTVVREICVPPEKRVLNVEVLPSKASFKPGERASVRLRVTDPDGEPVRGSLAVAVYDQAVEYISGGSNVPEIRAFFWKWRRGHRPVAESNAGRWEGPLARSGEERMRGVGVFGSLVADEEGAGGGVGRDLKKKEVLRADASMSRQALGMAAPAAAPAAKMAAAVEANGFADAASAPAEPEAPAAVRSAFADTAFWRGTIETAADGTAAVEFPMPENLTGWKIRAWSVGEGFRVGEGTAVVTTFKDLLVRLQAPRFFVEKDEVVLSANVHNYLTSAAAVRAVLELDGGALGALGPAEQRVTVPAGGETRVDWRVRALREGEAVVRVKALSAEESDAVEMRFPVAVHGMAKTVSFSGAVRPEGAGATLVIDVPAERRVDETLLEIRYSPTLAGALVDALPYLAAYPYGCTEQTLNRFVPTVVTRRVLERLGLDLAAIREKRTNLDAQQTGDDAERAKGWKRWRDDPVFDPATLDDMVAEGVGRLAAMQNADGGWGWFSGWRESSWPHTTATVVHGLQVARASEARLPPGMLERGAGWLRGFQEEQVRRLRDAATKRDRWKPSADALDALVYMILAEEGQKNEAMRDFLYRDRNDLPVYAKAVFAIALHRQGEAEKLAVVRRNIDQYLVRDAENQTAWLRLPNEGYWWWWYGSEIESLAYYLKLLALTEPKDETAPAVAKYLLNNRKHATYWNSTRDTALCVEALAEFLAASGEARPDLTVEVLLDGRRVKEERITAANLFQYDNKVVLRGAEVPGGRHTVELRRTGTGPLYWNAYLSYFTLEDFIARAGLEVKVDRAVYRLVPDDRTADGRGERGQAVGQRTGRHRRERLESGDALASGELVEVELTVDAKNDYEYLVVEDMKAAGFEAVDVRSGYTEDGLGAYAEFRDERTAFFMRVLPRGRSSVSYRLRAEIPGSFSALPARAWAMYAPELRANSDEIKLGIGD